MKKESGGDEVFEIDLKEEVKNEEAFHKYKDGGLENKYNFETMEYVLRERTSISIHPIGLLSD